MMDRLDPHQNGTNLQRYRRSDQSRSPRGRQVQCRESSIGMSTYPKDPVAQHSHLENNQNKLLGGNLGLHRNERG
jgi:hypothetical protein